jgi:VIT1/CCC1 family predicted Fe2+/Mn2+ transporter
MWLKKPEGINKQQGIAFGTMDGVVNILGVLLSLSIATDSRVAVIAGVLAAGLANAFANSSGFYVSEETEGLYTEKEIIVATIIAFVSSFGSAILVLLPIFLINLVAGLWLSFIIGIILLFIVGYFFSHVDKKRAVKIGLKYVAIGIIVSAAGFALGLVVDALV